MSTAAQRLPEGSPGSRGAAACRVLMALCAGAFAIAILLQVLRYGVDIPFWDQWDFVGALRRISEGGLSWKGLLATSQAEHQIGVQVLLSAAAWRLTGMYMPALMVVNWAAAALFCLLAMAVTRRALPPGSVVPWLVLGAAAFFVFNPAAYQVWLWGLPLVHLLVPLLFLAGVFAAQSRLSDGLKIVTAGAAALAASHILGSGLLLWAMFPPVLWHYGAPRLFRSRPAAAALFGLALVGSLAPYAFGSHASPGPADGSAGPRVVAAFFLAYTGNLVSLATEGIPAVLAQLAGAGLLLFFGAIMTLAAREFRGKPPWPAVLIWGAVGGYSILAGALVALGRHRFGVPYAVESSRYVLASSFLPMACAAMGFLLVAALARLPARLRLYSWVLGGTVALVVSAGVLRAVQTPRAWALMEHTHYSHLTGKTAVAAANLVPLPEFRHIFPNSDQRAFILSANFLNRRGWLRPPLWDEKFVSDLARQDRRAEPDYGRVEALERTAAEVQLSGWAYLADRRSRPHAIIVLGGGRILAVLFPSAPGPDGKARWSGEVPLEGTSVRCFAYDAASGVAHLLPGV